MPLVGLSPLPEMPITIGEGAGGLLQTTADDVMAMARPSSHCSSRRGSFQDEMVDESLRRCATQNVLAHISTYIPPQVLVDLRQGIDLRWHSELREITTIFISLPEPPGLTPNASMCQLQRAYAAVASETSRIGGSYATVHY